MKTKAIFIVILSGILFFLPFYLFAAEDNQKELIQKRQDLGTLQKKIKDSQRKKKQAQKKEKAAVRELKKIGSELNVRKRELSIYDWNLEKNRKQREELFLSLEELADERQEFAGCLIKELKLRFKEGLTPALLVFPAELGKLTTRTSLEAIVDKAIIPFAEKLNKEFNLKEAEKDKLEKYRELELTYKKAAEKKEKKAKTLHRKKRKELTRHQRAKKQQDKKLKEFKGQILAMEKMIKRLEKAQRAAGGFRGGHFRKSKGKLLVPANGSLAKVRYGNSSDIYKGIMIKAPAGSEVFSVANGEVLYGDWFRGFGNIVIIDHGGGYSTLYAHLQKILVKTKEKVGGGRIIARVGDTGSLTLEPRLYFEIRRHGESLNPLEWLAR
ncbi:MAG: peptidoglycan DD-metalloendopeptidase family protein [Candidatus Ratteibacteria bacterium]|nr:peptidoglycan DD-metalloendopeptidase family protein [Candidatus Ratteibacteria bacterium]